MANYLHGVRGLLMPSVTSGAQTVGTTAAYVGTAPVNLVRGYKDLDLVNHAVQLSSFANSEATMGYSSDWSSFTLCEAMATHFNNAINNVGDIYVINVLDPATHVSDEKTTVSLTFVNKKATVKSDTIIIDSFAIEGKTEGVDYSLSYSYANGTLTVTLLKDSDASTLSAAYDTVDVSKVTANDIIGEVTSDGVYKGLEALEFLWQDYGVQLSLLAAPGWSDKPAVYQAMCAKVQKLNNHWYGMVAADIPISSATTIEEAKKWKTSNGYDSEFSVVGWPMIKDSAGNVHHMSTEFMVTQMAVDSANNDIPFESASNKAIDASSLYFGEGTKNRGLTEQTANELNAAGITTAVYSFGDFVLWGPHTAAYKYGGSQDVRDTFVSYIRVLEYIINSFQTRHAGEIDTPLTVNKRDSIIADEISFLNGLKSVGALVGDAAVTFVSAENSSSDIMNGEFTWNVNVTVTPDFKSATIKAAYTDEGLSAFTLE